ncbi:unnamed protein product [Trichobilharzia regenti]|nr:unnamed protein product [Trichobilharzia regenti]
MPSSHVSESMGTGLVHIAPCHGKDDFDLAKRHNLSLKLFVDESGCFTEDVGFELAGLQVLGKGNTSAIKLLEPITVHKEVITHSYPYDWRTKKPVIIRLSDQWFVDTEKISSLAMVSFCCSHNRTFTLLLLEIINNFITLIIILKFLEEMIPNLQMLGSCIAYNSVMLLDVELNTF